MAEENKLVVQIDLEKGDVKTAFRGVEKESRDSGKKSGERFSSGFESSMASTLKVGAKLLSIAVGIAGAFSFAKSIKAAQVQEDAINQLNSALIATGKFSEETSKSFQEYASELQKVTRFGDEAILSSAALLQSLGNLDEQGLKRATKATADLAAALRIDLNTAATLVGKAAEGNIGTFSRYGVSIKKGRDNAETFSNTLDALTSKFGGAAERDVNTFSGAISQLSNNFGDLLEKVGDAIIKQPVITKAIKALSDVFVQVQEPLQNFIKSIDIFDDILFRLVDFASGVIKFVVAPIELVGNIFKVLQATINTAFATLVADIGRVGGAVATVLEIFNKESQLAKDLRNFGGASIEVLQENLDDLKSSAESVFDFSVADKLDQKNEEFRAGLVNLRQVIQEESAITAPIASEQISKPFEDAGYSISNVFAQVAKEMRSFSGTVEMFARDISNTLKQGIGVGAGNAFAAFGKAMASGQNGLDAFLNSFLQDMGKMAQQVGQMFILKGAALMWAGQPNGGPLIAAGAALAAFGGAMGFFAGGGATAGAGSSQIQNTPSPVTMMDQDTFGPASLEPEAPRTEVNLVIQGDILDSDESGSRIVNLINSAFDKQGVVLNQAFA